MKRAAPLFTGIVLVAALGTPALADPAKEPTATGSAQDPHEIICRRLPNTGSLLPGPKVCHERWEWDEIQRQSQAEVEKSQRLPGAHPG